MIEKTFLEEPLSSPSPALKQKREDIAASRATALLEKRNRVRNYISASLKAPLDSIELIEGMDVWDAHRGRYKGRVEVSGVEYKFTAQSYASGVKIFTHFTIESK